MLCINQLKKLLENKPEIVIANQIVVAFGGRVCLGYRIGEILYSRPPDDAQLQLPIACGNDADFQKNLANNKKAIVHFIGERPGNGHKSFAAYIVAPNVTTWNVKGVVSHQICKVVSGIAKTARHPIVAAN